MTNATINISSADWSENKTYSLGIEFGSTRIKASLINARQKVVCSASLHWESICQNNLWTYDLATIQQMLRDICSLLENKILKIQAENPSALPDFHLDSLGISAMMHGYLAFDENMELLTSFRTWRCTNTTRAAEELSKRWQVNIPLRWSIAHLYQAILDGEQHVNRIAYFTTLSGYLHYLLTGEKVLGIGDASGMFPLDYTKNDYREDLIKDFETLVASRHHLQLDLRRLLPHICLAGEIAGKLTEEGLQKIGASQDSPLWKVGLPCCPPEGDAGTGMIATNSIAARTANISAGTSLFAMLVLDKEVKEYAEIDRVATPHGRPVAMVHCNNCTVDINQWVNLFQEIYDLSGDKKEPGWLIQQLFEKAAESPINAAATLACGFQAGEPLSNTAVGVPLLAQLPPYQMTLGSLMRSLIYSSLATLKLGMEILNSEHVSMERIVAHGGLFKTPKVAQKMMAIALETPTSVFKTAEEGGSWGIALLAQYMLYHKNNLLDLESYLENIVFAASKIETLEPDPKEIEAFLQYYQNYKKLLQVENSLSEIFHLN